MASMNTTFLTPELARVASEVADLLKIRGESVCVAETAAGGLISAALLAMPGASRFYKGGLTLYTLEARVAYAGWTQEDIAGYRGPTGTIVGKLATNVRQQLGATYGISESGTAGPTGGDTYNRTPGFVAVAVATEANVYEDELSTGLGGDREANMVEFAAITLSKLLLVLQGKVNKPATL